MNTQMHPITPSTYEHKTAVDVMSKIAKVSPSVKNLPPYPSSCYLSFNGFLGAQLLIMQALTNLAFTSTLGLSLQDQTRIQLTLKVDSIMLEPLLVQRPNIERWHEQAPATTI